MSICLTLGANPQGDRIGFRYWESPNGPFASYKFENATGTFLGVWAVFVNALFAYMASKSFLSTWGVLLMLFCFHRGRNLLV